jgi:DNA repair photolyase
MEYIPAKTLVQRNKSTAWFGTEYNMNIYKGCCHGCIYCDSRSECYHIDNFDTIRAKKDALQIVRDDLRRKVKPGVIGTGSMSDPYNPFEKEFELTRKALMLIDAYQFGVAIATKSPLVARDIDILKDIQAHSPVIVKMTITTADDVLCKKIEPNVGVTSERFTALKQLSDNGIYCGILLMPLLPFVNDTKENVLGIIAKAKESGVKFIYPAFGVTLRQNQRDYFYNQIEKQFPGLSQRYEKQFGTNYQCGSPKGKELYYLFAQECEKAGILYKMQDIVRSYRQGYETTQLTFF